MKHVASCVLFAALAALTGCQSSIVPLQPLREVEYDETGHIYGPVTTATAPATSTAPTTSPSWNSGHPKDSGATIGYGDVHDVFPNNNHLTALPESVGPIPAEHPDALAAANLYNGRKYLLQAQSRPSSPWQKSNSTVFAPSGGVENAVSGRPVRLSPRAASDADASKAPYGTLGTWAIAQDNATSTAPAPSTSPAAAMTTSQRYVLTHDSFNPPSLEGIETFATTAPATSTAPTAISEFRIQNSELKTTTAPATEPARKTRMLDPNQATRYAYRTNYDYLWQKSLQYVSDMDYTIDRQDYRLGIIITKPNFSSHLIEPWKRDQTDFNSALENTINSHRRTIRITISRAPNPAFYEVGVQVLVERQSNPPENVGGPIGASAGRTIGQGADFGATPGEGPRWRILGHDPKLERKIIDQLFKSL